MFRRPPQQIAQIATECPSEGTSARSARTIRPAAPRRPVLGVLIAVSVVLALLGASCTGDDSADPSAASPTSFSLPPAENTDDVPTVTIPEGFVLVDARGVKLTPFESKPKNAEPPLPVRGGGAALSGQVTGPEGPVAGASVLLERVVGNRTGSITVSANGDGRYQAQGIHGGKYRVRAWLAPTLASRSSALAYVADLDGKATVDLGLELFTGRSLQVGLDLTAVNVGDTANVRALLTDQVVGGDGIVTGQAIASAEVKLSGSGSMDYEDATATTNGAGLASWKVTCTREGTTTFTASTEGATGSFTSPSCGPRPTTTTTAAGPEVQDFPVGDEFDVPFKAALPAGTYETFLDGCKTTYEVYVNGSWQTERKTASGGTIVLSGPGRDFKAADGSKGCKYRRKS